jgi:hypothetical protein
LGVGLGDLDAHLAFGRLDLRFALEAAVCSPIARALASSATRTDISRSASLVPISRCLVAWLTSISRSRSAAATPMAPFLVCSATSISACWIASLAALRPSASM